MSKRKNIMMSDELAKWYEDKAKALGVSQSNLMAIALDQYVRMQENRNVIKFQDFVKEIDKFNRAQPEK